MRNTNRVRLVRKKKTWSHKSWNIINKRKMMKENRLRRLHSLEVRKNAVKLRRRLKEMAT